MFPGLNAEQESQWRTKLKSAFGKILNPMATPDQPVDFKQAIGGLYNDGISGLRFPSCNNGLEHGLAIQGLFAECLGDIPSGSIGMGLTIQLDMVAPLIEEHGTEAQINRFLKPAIRGELLFSHAVSEAKAGSDISNIQTEAIQENGGWRINGKKTMISMAPLADCHFVLARLAERRPPFNMVILLVPQQSKGLAVGKTAATMGNKNCAIADISFNDVWVDDTHRIGGIGMGFVLQLQQFIQERILSALRANQVSRRCLDQIIKHAKSRQVYSKPLHALSVIKQRIAILESNWDLSRAATYKAFDHWLNNNPYQSLSSTAKLLSSQLAREVSREGIRLGGVSHYLSDQELAQWFLDARLFSISTGSDEMMLKSIASFEKYALGVSAKEVVVEH